MEKNIEELKKKYNTSINNVIKYFKKNSILFVSEADFQFSFGTKLREELKNEDCEIIFEYPMEIDDKKVMTYTDIMVVEKANSKKYFIPIELKYKTDEANITAHGLKNIPLKKHGAYDCGCYLYLKDIERIEKFKSLVKKEAEEDEFEEIAKWNMFWGNKIKCRICNIKSRFYWMGWRWNRKK